MPAVSKKQQRFFGYLLSNPEERKKKGISKKAAKDFASDVQEVAPPGWGHTKAEKEKTKPDKPKSKIGGTAAAFKRALDDGRFKGLPGSKTKKEKTADMFKLMWSMKKKGDKPHYKPGTDEKYKKYQEEGASIIQGGTSSKKVSYRGATSEKSQPKKSASFRGEKDESIPSKHKSARYASQLHRLRPRAERLKVNEEELLEKRRRPYISIKTRVKKGIGREPLKDVNKPGEKKSMQDVGGFRGVHGASRKSKSAQGPAARVEYRRKSPADTSKPAPPKGTFYALQKRVKEELSPMQDNNLFGNAYAGSYKQLKKKIGSKKKHTKPAVEEGRVDASYSQGQATFSSFYDRAKEARKAMARKSAKKIEYDKKNEAVRADTKKHGIKFSDKKGTGRIVKGKKRYD